MKLTREKILRVCRVVMLSLALAAPIGYFSFYVTMPSVSVPTTDYPNLAVMALIIFGLGILVGLLSESLEEITIEILLGVVIGPLISWLIFISPSFRPYVILPDASGYIYNVLHSALPLMIVSLIVLFIGGFIGTSVMENMMVKAAPSPFGEPVPSRQGQDKGERKQ